MIKIHLATNGEFYFVIYALNGKALLTSETYKSKQSVMKAIAAMAVVVMMSCGYDRDNVKEIEIRDEY